MRLLLCMRLSCVRAWLSLSCSTWRLSVPADQPGACTRNASRSPTPCVGDGASMEEDMAVRECGLQVSEKSSRSLRLFTCGSGCRRRVVSLVEDPSLWLPHCYPCTLLCRAQSTLNSNDIGEEVRCVPLSVLLASHSEGYLASAAHFANVTARQVRTRAANMCSVSIRSGCRSIWSRSLQHHLSGLLVRCESWRSTYLGLYL